MSKLPNIVTRNLNKKLQLFTNNQTAQQPTKIDLDDVRGVYNIGSPGEPQPLVIHKRDAIVIGSGAAADVTLFFDEFPELLEMIRTARRILWNGITMQIENEASTTNFQYQVNILGYDQNGQKAGQIVDAGDAVFLNTASGINNSFFTSAVVGRAIMNSNGRFLETNAGVQEFTEFTLSEIFFKFFNVTGGARTMTNFWGFLEFWF